MATTDKNRPHVVMSRGEHTGAPTATASVYAVGPDEMDLKLSDLLNLKVRGSGRPVRSPKSQTPASKTITKGACTHFLVDIAALAKVRSPHPSTVLLRLSMPRGEAMCPSLVVEPEHSTDMVQALLDTSFEQLKEPDAGDVAMQRALTQRTVDSVLQGTRWLTSAELNSVRKDKKSNPSMTIGRWLQSGSLFALESRGARVIPAYALDQLGEPIALLKPVLSLMKGRTSFLIAAWFESPNSYLDGKRPRELLATRGLDVVRAAELHVAEDFHG
jgi:hypothetical protein